MTKVQIEEKVCVCGDPVSYHFYKRLTCKGVFCDCKKFQEDLPEEDASYVELDARELKAIISNNR